MIDAEILLQLAKLDEPNQRWEIYDNVYLHAKEPYEKMVGYRYPAHSGWINCKPYLISRDAIIPLVEKQTDSVIASVCMRVIADKSHRKGFKLLLAQPRLLCTSLVEALLVEKG